MGSIDWGAVWEFMWPIIKEGIIALLMALLALLGYDQVVPSRYVRRHPLEQAALRQQAQDAALRQAQGAAKRKRRAKSDARKVKT